MNNRTKYSAPKGFHLLFCAVFAILLFAFNTRATAPTGELDRDFNPTITADATSIVQTSVVQPDGKTIVGGTFLKINNRQVNHVARFNADGSLDTTFDAGGGVTVGGSAGVITTLALQPDGKIIIGGGFEQVARQIRYKLARLNADGSFDASFNANIYRLSGAPTALAVQPDGKILLGGSILFGNPNPTFTSPGIVRLNADGSRDTTFVPPSGSPSSIVVQTDGKILIAGDSFVSGGQTRAQVARLNPNGSLDVSFTGTTYDSTAFVAVPSASGKIYVGGAFQNVGGQQRRGLALLNADGTRDDSFADASNSRSGIRKIVVQSDGKPVFCGEGTFSNAVRANLDGSPDTAFVTRSRLNGGVYTVGVLPDDRIIVGGDMDVYNAARTAIEKRRFAALDADGTLDEAVNPYVANSFGSSFDGATVIAQPDGKILYSDLVFTEVNRVVRRNIVRLNADGTTDSTFNLPTNFFAGTTRITALGLQSDGKILFATLRSSGSTNRNLGRLNADGSLDSSFADSVSNSYVTRFAIQPNGQIIIKGFFSTVAGQTRDGVARLNADGSLDSFTVPTGLKSSNPSASDALVQPDGKFLITLHSDANGTDFIARFNADGSLDSTFARTVQNGALPLVLQPDGKVIASNGGNLYRLNANGTADSSFVTSGLSGGRVYTAAVMNNGKILVGGQFITVSVNFTNAQARAGYARFNTDGTLDNAYGVNGGAITASNAGTDSLAVVFRIALQPDGKALIAGVIRYVNNFSQPTLARLKTSAVAGITPTSDFDGDGKTDLAVFRPSNAVWYSINSTSGFSATSWGLSTDKLTPADYDGDGKTDLTVWREDTSNPDLSYFFILQSSTNTLRVAQFGRINDNPYFSGDWDGDGKADPTVFRDTGSGQTYFYYAPSNQPSVKFVAVPWGVSGDLPVRGDFDGDGKQDAAVFRPSNGVWYILQSSNNQFRAESWGSSGDKSIAADYDGDGKTDLAVLRGTNWYIKQSSDAAFKACNWGLSTDAAVPADYDGDGKTDVAVFRNGVWYIIQSSNLQVVYGNFGAAGDVPIPLAN